MNIGELRPIQALAAALLFRHKKLIAVLPRQFGGKTELGVKLNHDLAMRPGPSTGLFIAKNTAARRKATREKFIRNFDKKVFAVNTELIYRKDEPTSQILMASVDKDPDANRGGTVNLLHWSEAAFSKIDHGETVPGVWQKVFRPMLSQTDGYAFVESTTNGHNSFKDFFDNAKDFGFKTLLVGMSQMLDLGLITWEEYQKEKSEVHPLIWAQEYECEWVTFQGLTYDEFDEKVHVDPDLPPPKHWQGVIGAIDWGFHPSATCVLFGYVQDGTVCIFDEIYETRQRIEDTDTAIKARQLLWSIGDFATVADHEEDRNEELIIRGIGVTKANKVNVLGNRLEIKELLWKNRLKIHPRCKNLIKDLRAAVWSDKKEGDLDYSLCTWGHFDAEAALRYLIRAFKAHEQDEPEENPHQHMDESSARAWEQQRRLNLPEDL